MGLNRPQAKSMFSQNASGCVQIYKAKLHWLTTELNSLRETTESLDLWYGLFLLRYRVYINHGMHPPPLQVGREERGKKFKEVFAGRGGSEIFKEWSIIIHVEELFKHLQLNNDKFCDWIWTMNFGWLPS